MLWDPSFNTWRVFGVQSNSEMAVMSADLLSGTSLFYGFDDEQRSGILDLLPDL